MAGFASGGVRGSFNAAYQSLQLFFLEFSSPQRVPITLQLARFVAPLLTLALTADAIRAIAVYLRDGGVGPFAPRDHTVICGLGRTGAAIALAQDAGGRGGAVVAITRDGHAERVRQSRLAGVRVIKGDATDPEVLRQARAHRARRVAIVCGDDRVNADVLEALVELRKLCTGGGLLSVLVQVNERLLTRALGLTGHSFKRIDGNIAVRPIDLPARVAEAMVERARRSPEFPDVRPRGSRRIVIVGFGALGQAVAAEAAEKFGTSEGELHVHVIDREADRKCEAFEARQGAGAAASVTRLQTEVESGTFEKAAFIDEDTCAVFVCPNNDPLTLAAGLHLAGGTALPVVCRVAIEDGGLTRVAEKRSNLHFVGMTRIAPQVLDDHVSADR